ncbi:uncharacterized protein N7473_007586 [Penicillium subrubescens]|nr:uncharacterized protein N7473_007586 [Penicillium subrubescens]KAJ5891358.1 hypothetical protein N7473_007586 [Penicillium subrubescens]
MDRILQEASAFVHTPQCNDTSVAMQWFASEVEGMGGIRTICGNASAVQSSTREADIWGPNDTSAALLGIIPQDETNSMSSYFNDTSIAMSAFAPQISHEGHLPPANG